MIEKIKSVFNKDETEKLLKYNEKYRTKHIPKRYNQIRLMDHLIDEDLDHYISISNRADGKSYNYCSYILKYCIEHNLGFTFIVRHFTVRQAGQKLFQKIIDQQDFFDHDDFAFMATPFYIVLIYKDRHIGIFTDLNQATDLKYQSNYLQDFPLIIYDEFLALEGDYLIDEWERLKTIYSSINRQDKQAIPHIKYPKILYLGNAVNFSSPVLANLNLFNIMENHQMNTARKYGNIVMEFNKNDMANEQRNLRAFDELNDPMTKAEFLINKHDIATEKDRSEINVEPDYLIIKVRTFYVKITYNRKTLKCIISIISYAHNYDYNVLLKDNNEQSTYLHETFYDQEHERKYNKSYYLFDNMYSKDNIVDGFEDLKSLRFNKIIKHHLSSNTLDNFEMREKVYKETYEQNTKNRLFKEFFLS